MKKIKITMINAYKMDKMDWMGYYLVGNDIFTYHHIKKKENGGLLTFNNGAILTSIAHPYLHVIEYKDLDMYKYINLILQNINYQGYMPTLEQLRIIDNVLKQFEREHSGEINHKGRYLIKEEYVSRREK